MLPGASPRKHLGSPAAVLTVAPLASGQAHYYLALTASAYYTQAPEPQGLWYGLGADEFGLKGTVKADDLVKLGSQPHTVRKPTVMKADEGRSCPVFRRNPPILLEHLQTLRKILASNPPWAQCSSTSQRILRNETGS
jgi:hypothetical protein